MSENRRVSRPSQDHEKQKPRKKGRWILRCLIWGAVFMMVCITFAALAAYREYSRISEDLPQISSLKDYRPPTITTVYSDDKRKIAEFYKERRIVLPLSEMPEMLIRAFIAAEDSRFYQHKGVDIVSIIRAFFKNIEAGTVVQGGSTITQQVTKSFLLSPEKSYERKLREAILAYRIEKAFSKEEVLFLYLNQIYLGHGAYGVEAAAGNYFGKSVRSLNLAECAILAGLPKAPGRDSPFHHPERAKGRQIYVLKRMKEEGFITEAQATEAINMKLDIKPRRNWYIEKVPFYTEYVRQYVEKKYGQDALYKDGLQIYTAVNIEMQKAARAAIDKGLRAYDKRHGYRGAIRHLNPGDIEAFSAKLRESLDKKKTPSGGIQEGDILEGVVIHVEEGHKQLTVRMGNARGTISAKDMKWARKAKDKLRVGDVIQVKIMGKNEADGSWELALDQSPVAQSALLCLETGSAEVRAMVGGRDFRKSQFNRAIQSRRQPGSSFKPIVYSAAIDKGYTPATEIIDNAIVYKDGSNKIWKPKNYDRKFYGPILFRKALAKSKNLATVSILSDIGVDYVVDYAKKLGVTSKLYGDLALGLGASGISLFEMVRAYSVFANLGELVEPVFITKILDRDGNEIENLRVERQQAIEKSTAYIMTSLLESVVTSGTGSRVRALKRPAAGKTGTTNNQHDAWFIGYTPEYVTGAWVGFDEERSLGKRETGAKAAIPVWLDFMQNILEDKPVQVFKVPKGVVFSQIDAKTGLLPVPETEKRIYECFKEGTVPTKHSKRPNSISDEAGFFKSDL